MAVYGFKVPEMAGNKHKWLEIAGMAEISCTFQRMARNCWKLLEMTEMAGLARNG